MWRCIPSGSKGNCTLHNRLGTLYRSTWNRKTYYISNDDTFYVLLYYVWRSRYQINGRQNLTIAVWGLALCRIILCMMPQNAWLSKEAPLSWGIYRNIPFTILGVLIVILFYKSAKNTQGRPFRFLWLAVVISFACYIPVVLFSDAVPAIGMLMIPKTCAYVWVVLIRYQAMKGNK